jgi:hypothetical protein
MPTYGRLIRPSGRGDGVLIVMLGAGAGPVTVTDVVPQMLETQACIVLVPTPSPVTNPLVLTVATLEDEELHPPVVPPPLIAMSNPPDGDSDGQLIDVVNPCWTADTTTPAITMWLFVDPAAIVNGLAGVYDVCDEVSSAYSSASFAFAVVKEPDCKLVAYVVDATLAVASTGLESAPLLIGCTAQETEPTAPVYDPVTLVSAAELAT